MLATHACHAHFSLAPRAAGTSKIEEAITLYCWLYTVGVLFHVECYIRQLWCSSIISFNSTTIAYNQCTDIYPLFKHINTYIYVVTDSVPAADSSMKGPALSLLLHHPHPHTGDPPRPALREQVEEHSSLACSLHRVPAGTAPSAGSLTIRRLITLF